MPASKNLASDSQSPGNAARGSANRTRPRRRRYSSAFDEDSDNGAPPVNSRRIDSAQAVQNNTRGHPSQRNSETQIYTTDSVSFRPVNGNHTHPLTISTSREFYIHTNDDGQRVFSLNIGTSRTFYIRMSEDGQLVFSYRGPETQGNQLYVFGVRNFRDHFSFEHSGQGSLSGQDQIDIFRILRNLVIEGQLSVEFGEPLGYYAQVQIFTELFNNVVNRQLPMTFEEPEVQFNTGLQEDELQKIPTINITKHHIEDKANCTVCFEDYYEGELVSNLPCQHLFHTSCIMEWLKSNGACPNCRINLNKK